jgi:hypothetical protein
LTGTLIYPGSDGVRFLESFGPKEDSDAPEVPSSASPAGDRASSIRHQNRPACREGPRSRASRGVPRRARPAARSGRAPVGPLHFQGRHPPHRHLPTPLLSSGEIPIAPTGSAGRSPPDRPEDVARAFVAALNAGRLKATFSCLTSDACLISPDATAIYGHESICELLAPMIDAGSRVAIDPERGPLRRRCRRRPSALDHQLGHSGGRAPTLKISAPPRSFVPLTPAGNSPSRCHGSRQ